MVGGTASVLTGQTTSVVTDPFRESTHVDRSYTCSLFPRSVRCWLLSMQVVLRFSSVVFSTLCTLVRCIILNIVSCNTSNDAMIYTTQLVFHYSTTLCEVHCIDPFRDT